LLAVQAVADFTPVVVVLAVIARQLLAQLVAVVRQQKPFF
jgi:hypothetical protein